MAGRARYTGHLRLGEVRDRWPGGLPSPGMLQEQGVRPAKALQDKVPQIDLLHGAGVDDALGSLTCTIEVMAT